MKPATKSLVFTFERDITIEDNMSFDIDEVMEKMRETGGCVLANVEIRPVEKSK